MHGWPGCASETCWPILTETIRAREVGYQLAHASHTRDVSVARGTGGAVRAKFTVMCRAYLLSSMRSSLLAILVLRQATVALVVGLHSGRGCLLRIMARSGNWLLSCR